MLSGKLQFNLHAAFVFMGVLGSLLKMAFSVIKDNFVKRGMSFVSVGHEPLTAGS